MAGSCATLRGQDTPTPDDPLSHSPPSTKPNPSVIRSRGDQGHHQRTPDGASRTPVAGTSTRLGTWLSTRFHAIHAIHALLGPTYPSPHHSHQPCFFSNITQGNQHDNSIQITSTIPQLSKNRSIYLSIYSPLTSAVKPAGRLAIHAAFSSTTHLSTKSVPRRHHREGV